MNDASQFKSENELSLIPFCKIFADMQKRNLELLTSANDIVLETVKTLKENQAELLRLESAQISDVIIALPPDLDLGEAISMRSGLWYENSEKMIHQMHVINELAYDCGWQLVKLCTRRVQQNAEHAA